MTSTAIAKAMQVRVDVDEKVQRYDLEKLEPLQGPLKSLSEENFNRLKKSILEEGFFMPLSLWHNGKSLKILDGHQRVRVLCWLRDHGWLVPKIPAIMILAKNLKVAKKRLLLITSSFGKFEREGLYEYVQDMDMDSIVEELKELSLPELDMDSFLDEFFNDIQAKEPPEGAQEISSTRFETFTTQCPKMFL